VKHNVRKEKEKDEKALMDDLMAGLDASMFSSPVKSQLSQAKGKGVMSPVRMGCRMERQRSPVKQVKPETHRSPLKPTIPTNRPIIPTKANGTNEVKRTSKAFVPIKLEVNSESIKPAPEVKIDIKPVLEDDDEFTFDFDLDELAGLDDDILLKPHVAAKSIHPVRNPEVPSPPVGYSSTPWLRCSVELVLDGLRFGDGVIPDVLDFSGAGSSTAVGKVSLESGFVSELILQTLVVTIPGGVRRVVHLKERWVDTNVKRGQSFSICSKWANVLTCRRYDQHHLSHPRRGSHRNRIQIPINIPNPPPRPNAHNDINRQRNALYPKTNPPNNDKSIRTCYETNLIWKYSTHSPSKCSFRKDFFRRRNEEKAG
jgi:hypothetical protein